MGSTADLMRTRRAMRESFVLAMGLMTEAQARRFLLRRARAYLATLGAGYGTSLDVIAVDIILTLLDQARR